MKTYLKIQSEGEIELGAFTLIGASTKREDSTKIGYYGSGLKYSVSALIRNGIEFKIFSGEREVLIATEKQDFRADSFEVIIVDGNKTSLTTNMGGADWDNPFAPIREIYSNALDEDSDATLNKSNEVSGRAGATTFYIEMTKDVEHFYKNVNMYFCNQNDQVLHANGFGAIYPSSGDEIRLFRKNILCHSSKEKALFHYNSPEFSINESRVISSQWIGWYYTGMIWKNTTDKPLIRQFISGLSGGNAGLWEHKIDWDSSHVKFAKEWGEVCREMKFVPAEIVSFCDESDLAGRVILPNSLLIRLYRQFNELDILGLTDGLGESKFIVKKKVSTILLNKVIDAIAILQETDYKYRMEDGLDIEYVTFTNSKILGYANNDKIYLSHTLDSYDVNAIAKIIIEENEHNRTGFGDKTREFQNHLFNMYFEVLTANKEN